MRRKLQIVLTDETWTLLENLNKEANQDFKTGFITMSDVVNEMILNAKIDLRSLQGKHTNVRKSLRQLSSQKDIDLDLVIKSLMELKSNQAKKSPKQQSLARTGEL
jgi:hypothetical protein